eukprot:NODE_144_length_17694_cov_0.489741.p8 type:complete len:232 gc:universal NODE_144_length_17694_cov_0.489741:12812-12117(-)
MSLLQRKMEDEQLEIEKKKKAAPKKNRFGKEVKKVVNTMKCCKSVELTPTVPQTIILRQWCGAYLWKHNKCVYFYTNFPHLRKTYRLRYLLVYNYSLWTTHNEWLLKIPMEIRDTLYNDFQKALDSNWAKKKKNPLHKFEFKWKCRNAKSTSIQFRTRDIIGTGKIRPPRPFPRFWGKGELKSKEPLVYSDAATKIVFKSAIKKYYTTITRDVVCENQAGKASNIHIVLLM